MSPSSSANLAASSSLFYSSIAFYFSNSAYSIYHYLASRFVTTLFLSQTINASLLILNSHIASCMTNLKAGNAGADFLKLIVIVSGTIVVSLTVEPFLLEDLAVLTTLRAC